MNAYVASSIASDHFDRLVAASAASRLAKEARLARRAHRAPAKHSLAHRALHRLAE